MAPKTMISTPMAMITPWMESAASRRMEMSQPKMAQTTQASQAKGMARVAGQRMPTMRTRATTMGMIAKSARNPIDMNTSLGTRFTAHGPKNQLESPAVAAHRAASAWRERGAPRRFAGRCQKKFQSFVNSVKPIQSARGKGNFSRFPRTPSGRRFR